MLAYTSRELADRVGRERLVAWLDYEHVGGVVGALQHHADRLGDDLTRRGHGAAVIPTLLTDRRPARRGPATVGGCLTLWPSAEVLS